MTDGAEGTSLQPEQNQGRRELSGRGEASGGRSGHTAASRTYTTFLLHPFPKPTVSVLSLWPRLCSTRKWSLTGEDAVQALGKFRRFIYFIFYFFTLKLLSFGSNTTSLPRAAQEPRVMTVAPIARGASCPEPQ